MSIRWERVNRQRYWLRGFGIKRQLEQFEDISLTPTALEMDTIQAWCKANLCGRRTSFDEFRFRNEQEMTAFLLRWS